LIFSRNSGQRRLTGAQIGQEFAVHPRGIADFLDSLVTMKVLERAGDSAGAKYSNTPTTALYLDRQSPATSAEFWRC
jgi:Dimerisation domain